MVDKFCVDCRFCEVIDKDRIPGFDPAWGENDLFRCRCPKNYVAGPIVARAVDSGKEYIYQGELFNPALVARAEITDWITDQIKKDHDIVVLESCGPEAKWFESKETDDAEEHNKDFGDETELMRDWIESAVMIFDEWGSAPEAYIESMTIVIERGRSFLETDDEA